MISIPIYLHITSISCTCVACPQGAGRDAWHTYSPVSFRFTWETSKLLFEYILTLSGGSCRGSPLSAKRIPSLHHLTLVCTLSSRIENNIYTYIWKFFIYSKFDTKNLTSNFMNKCIIFPNKFDLSQ